MMPPGELASIRRAADRMLPDTCVIQRVTRTPDGAGGSTETWATVATMACRVSPAGQGDEHLFGGRLASVSGYVVTLPAETDVAAVDRIAWGGRTLEVAGVVGPRSYEVSRRVVAVEVL